jgi:hypothetical protein
MSATVMTGMNTLEEQQAHYRAVRARLGLRVYTPVAVVPAARIPPPPPPPAPPQPKLSAKELKRKYEMNKRAAREAKLLSMLQDLAKRPNEANTYNLFLIIVADKHGLPYNFVASRSRLDKIVLARAEYYYLLKTQGKKSYPQIAQQVGRDHTTILHAVKRYCALTGCAHPA